MSVKLTPPAVVDARGNITIHGQQGVTLTLTFTDLAGDPKDMTGKLVWFETEDGLVRIQLTAGAQVDQMYLIITQGDLDAYVGKSVGFIILDETSAQHELFWNGTLSVRGWIV